jgi:hypothetical protein
MSALTKAAGYAALLQVVVLVALFVLYLVVLPGSGASGPNAFYDSKTLSAAPVLQAIAALNLPIAAITLLVALALFDRLRGQAPGLIWLATAAGLIATALLLASGAIGFKGLAVLAGAPDRAGAGIALPALAGVMGGLDDAGLFALGWWVFLASWAALRAGALPRWLNYLGLLVGALYIVSLIVPTQPVSPLLQLVWSAWLGITLLREKSA